MNRPYKPVSSGSPLVEAKGLLALVLRGLLGLQEARTLIRISTAEAVALQKVLGVLRAHAVIAERRQILAAFDELVRSRHDRRR